MHRVHHLIAITRKHRRKLLAAALCIAAVAGFVLLPRIATAQMQYDFNGDGKVTCADFEQQYPKTYTDEATKALQKYPKDLAQLNGNAKENDVACEGQPASTDPAKKSTPAATPTPTRATATPQPTPAPALSAPTPGPAGTTAVPADVMSRVEGCAVVAISERDVVGAGCPGGGNVMFRIPDDAPPLSDAVIVQPRSPLASSTTGASSGASPSKGSSLNTSGTKKSGSGKNTAKTSKDKNKKSKSSSNGSSSSSSSSDTTNGKNDKHHKHHGKHKNNKHGKKHGKK